MRNLILIVLLLVFVIPFSCTMPEPKNEKLVDDEAPQRKDAFHQLCQYWEITDAERPTYRDLNEHEENVYNIPGIVFMTDSTFLENPKASMRYGKFTLKGREINARFDDGKKAVYTIQEKEGNNMTLKRSEKEQSTILYVKGSEVFWPDANKNPYNKVNSEWRIKPEKPESENELKERLRGCVQFYQYFLKGYVESKSAEIDFSGCHPALNGTRVEFLYRTKKSWMQNGSIVFIQKTRLCRQGKPWKMLFQKNTIGTLQKKTG